MDRFSRRRMIDLDVIMEVERELVSLQRKRKKKKKVTLSLQDIMLKAQRPDLLQKREAILMIRKFLTGSYDAKRDLLSVGLVPLLVEYLQHEDFFLQFEAALIMADITSSRMYEISECGVIPALVTLLSSEHSGICEQVVRSLANISTFGEEEIETIASSGAMPSLLKLVNESTPLNVYNAVSYAIANLCNNRRARKALIESGIVSKIMPLLSGQDDKIIEPTLLILGGASMGTDNHIQFLLDQGILIHLKNLLNNPKLTCIQNVLWTLHKVTENCQQDQIQMVLDAQLIPPLIQEISQTDRNRQGNALFVICSLLKRGSSEQVSTIVQHGCIGPMCNLINDRWQRNVVVEIILNGLKNCLKHVEIAFKLVEESGAIDKIKQLKKDYSRGISKAADTLLKVYFRGYCSIPDEAKRLERLDKTEKTQDDPTSTDCSSDESESCELSNDAADTQDSPVYSECSNPDEAKRLEGLDETENTQDNPTSTDCSYDESESCELSNDATNTQDSPVYSEDNDNINIQSPSTTQDT